MSRASPSPSPSPSRRRLLALGGVLVCTLSGVNIAGGGEAQPELPKVRLLVGDVPLEVEVASSGEQRYMGLSFREELAADAGMLFVYPDERPLTFTMRDTLLPLSIAFVSDALVIDEIVDMDVGPGQLFPSARPARFALEVNQGWFGRNGIGPGATITLP